MKTDIQIAQETQMLHINEIAKKIGLSEDDIEQYGKYKAKVDLDVLKRHKEKENGKLILVTAITPTPAGEGKSTVTIGLTQALNKIGKLSSAAIREPSLGPIFGMKGGAAGGGYAQVVPMEDINLHFTGDMHAIGVAHNLISACIDNHINSGNQLGIDLTKITWKRVVDMNDRALRKVVIGLGGKANGVPRESSFQITVGSEIMAILCLSNNIKELKEKIGNIVFATSYSGQLLRVSDLHIEGAVAALLKDAIKPNLVQTLEHTPVFIHGGPFANIAHGCNSILATKMALKLTDYVVTEAGFAADLGAEKFLDIKCRMGGLTPNAVVLVATVRAIKHHGDGDLAKGMANLEKHLEIIQTYGLPAVVAINKFVTDTEEEIAYIEKFCNERGAEVSLCEVWAKGGEGGIDLANKVVKAIEENGGNVVVYENCGGAKSVDRLIDEDAEDIYQAIAERYLAIGCSVMTPDTNRYELLERLLDEYQVEGVVEMTLQACHTYNIEAKSIEKRVKEKGLPYIHIETDYSQADVGQLDTRIAAFLEMI